MTRPMATERLAAIYSRISTAEQAKTSGVPSTTTQVDRCREQAVLLNIPVAASESGLIIEETHSGTDLRWVGTQFMRLVERAQRHEFTDLFWLDIDRFCRGGPEAYYEQLGYFTNAGVTVHWVVADIPRDMPFSQTITTARAEAAQWIRDKIVEASIRVRTASAAAGHLIPGKFAPFGWRFVEDPLRLTRRGRPLKVGLEPDPINGPILLHMYQHIAAGGGIVPLKHWLEARAIPAPKGGMLWQEASIRHILHNSTNWGERRSFATRTVPHSQGVRRPATQKSRVRHEPVPLEQQYEVDPSVIRTIPGLDRDLAMRTLAVLAENRRQHQIAVRGANAVTEAERAERGLLFGGMVKCGTCGGGLRLKHGLRNNWMYYCSHHGTCHAGEPSISMSSRLLDPVVWRYATYAISDPAFFERLLQQTDEVAGPAAIASAQQQTLAEAEHERDILQKHLRRLDPDDPDNAGLVASVDDDLRRVVARIVSLSRALDASRAAVEAEEARRATLAAFHAYAVRERETLDQKTRLEQHQMLRVLRTRVRLRAEGSPDRIRIVFDIRHLPGAAAWLRPDLSETPDGYVDFGPDNLPLVSLEVLQTEGAEPFGEMTFDETSDAEWQERGFASEEEYLEWTMHKTVEDTPVEEPPVVPAGRWHS